MSGRACAGPSGGRASLLAEMATAEIVDYAALSLDELEAELATLASHLYAGTCRWLELVAELDRRGGWAESGQACEAEEKDPQCGPFSSGGRI
jgi:hypothetical protein